MAGAPIHTPTNFLTSKFLESCHLIRFPSPSPFLSVPNSKLGLIGGCVMTGSTRKPMEFARLNQLIDATVSSSDMESQYAAKDTLDDEGIKTSGTRNKISIGSFGRLKTQKVKAIVAKVSTMYKESTDDDGLLTLGNGVPDKFDRSHSKNKFLWEKKRANAFKNVEKSSRSSDLEDKYPLREKKRVNAFKNVEKSSRSSDLEDKYPLREKKRVNALKNVEMFSRSPDMEDKYPLREIKGVNALKTVEKSSRSSDLEDKHHRAAPNLSGSEPLVSGVSAAHFRGWGSRDSFNDYEPEPTKFMSKQQKFSESGFFSRKSFKDVGCSEYMIESLNKQSFIRPSQIQAKAYARVIEGKSCIIADQSGSGKTLAYLAPLIQRLRQEELQGLRNSSSKNPQIVIIVPTAELASQVLSNCRCISKFGVPFRSMVVTGGFRQKTQLENLRGGVDVLIATPGRLMILINEGFLQLSDLRCAVMDEVDILYNDEDFEVALQSLMQSSPVNTQYLFVTATLPVDIYNTLVENFPDCEVIMGPGMHRVSPGLEEVLVDCSGEDELKKTPDAAFSNKKDALLQIVEGSPVSKTIVFCNKIETCRRVENVLVRFDRKGSIVQVIPFHAALARESRLANMEAFTNSHSNQVSKFLVCTDRASRGIDFSNVDHVILFDFPRDPSEYVRRVGRTARGAGGKGKAFIFVVGKQVSLARRIIERNRKGHPLHDVPSAYELTN